MIAALIRWSIANRVLVLLATVLVTVAGVWSLLRTPVDALPDLSDVQVIVRTSFPGQAPQIVENQVTYPLTSTMLSVPGAKTVRGYSFYGDSFVYILFEDGTDPYWARSRVLEYLSQVQTRLPPQARSVLGPDASGVGWVYQYALVDRSGKNDLAQLRALQDWFLKFELTALPNVAEVASIGGMVRQYQIVLDPDRLRSYNVTHASVIDAVRRANQESGGSVLELGEAEYMVRASGYLIERAVNNLQTTLIEEFIVVALVCAAFLFHLRSSLVAIVSLPVGILIAYIVMYVQGVNANIMSLGGIAIAIGAMVDGAVVMIENAHKHIEAWHRAHPGEKLRGETHWNVIGAAAAEVGPALFFSLLIIVLSFIPVFALQAQEGRLFSPLAYTKTYAMAASAGLAVTLVPVLIGYMVRGRIPHELDNPLNRGLIALYRPALDVVLRYPKVTVLVAFAVALLTLWPMTRLGGEFMPPLDEGDLLYMPSALPGLSIGKAAELVQQTDRLIKTVPEVASVYGKAGRAETATDPAPLEMLETTIQFKPRDQWRPGMTPEKLVAELDRVVQVPGLANVWVPPIRNRIDMLATGIKSPVGVKVAGTDLREIDRITAEIERVAKQVPGVSSALAERLSGGRYIDVDIDRNKAARYGMNIADVQEIVSSAIGGDNIGETVEGLQRFPINVRYPREVRDSLEKLRQLPVLTARGAQIRLGDVAAIRISDGPPMLRSENARISGWVYIDIRERDLRSTVRDLQAAVAQQTTLAPGYSVSWSGQFEYLERATERLTVVVPATLLIIFVLLFMTFRRLDEAALVMATLPFALAGGVWLLWALEHDVSVASGVGFIALAGVAAEFGVIMLIYLKQNWEARAASGARAEADLLAAIREGAVMRVRPKAMTVVTIVAGLLPVMIGAGTGSEVMQRIAAPMVGGMITAPLLSMFVVPAVFLLMRRRELRT